MIGRSNSRRTEKGEERSDGLGDLSGQVADMFKHRRLTPTQRRIAQFLIEHAAEAAHMSSNEVAASAGTSQPSVTRLAMCLGFSGFASLRKALRTAVAGRPPEPERAVRRTQLDRAVVNEMENLNRLKDVVANQENIAAAGHALMNSKPLPVLGLRSAAPLAAHFCYFASRIHPDVHLLDTGGGSLTDRVSTLHMDGARTALAFLLPRYPREAVTAIRDLHDHEINVILVSDTVINPAAEYAGVMFPAGVGTDIVFDAYSAPILMATILVQAMCDADSTQTQKRLEYLDRVATHRKIYTR